MYNKLNLEVGKVASKSFIKPGLTAIAFYDDRTVATDSFRMIEISKPGVKEFSRKTSKDPVLKYAPQAMRHKTLFKKDQQFEVKDIICDTPIHDQYPKIDDVIDKAEINTKHEITKTRNHFEWGLLGRSCHGDG